MDTSRKVNANAGKVGRYRPDAVAEEFGQPNMAAPGAGISPRARVPIQGHRSGGANGMSPQDHSSGVGARPAPGMSVGNTGPHPAGVSGPSQSVAGKGVKTTHSPAGDGVAGRRGGRNTY
ncbi:MAG: hypothetical protein QNI96_05250 [Woeseiaceae bacterium]|nr:hypothetical protein [Woeseiaceae bacterium]